MISWHKVGQKVVCVNNDRSLYCNSLPYRPTRLKINNIYTIRNIFINPYWKVTAFRLEEIQGFFDAFGYESGWGARRFKPVYPQAIDKLRELLNPTPEQKRPVLEEIIMDRVAGLST